MNWNIEPHVCRVCGGRVLSQETDGEEMRYRCSNCGQEELGRRPWVLCGCGMRIRGAVDAGLRCRPNPDVSVEVPAEIVVMQSSDKSR